MDPTTIVMLVGLASLLVERLFTWATRIRRSRCACGSMELNIELASSSGLSTPSPRDKGAASSRNIESPPAKKEDDVK